MCDISWMMIQSTHEVFSFITIPIMCCFSISSFSSLFLALTFKAVWPYKRLLWVALEKCIWKMTSSPTHHRRLEKSGGDFLCLDIFFFFFILSKCDRLHRIQIYLNLRKSRTVSVCHFPEVLQFVRMHKIPSIEARWLAV